MRHVTASHRHSSLCRRDVRSRASHKSSPFSSHMLHSLILSLALASRLSLMPQPDSVRPDNDIRLVALRHSGEIQRCYETEGLRVNPGLSGMIEVEITVAPSGRVEEAEISSSALNGAGRQQVESCITSTVRNWRFEKGPFAPETIVYPFNLVRERGVISNTRA